MNFFNKYKDLFEVSQNSVIPNSRLTLDNELWIQKPYLGTKTQEYTLNSKLKQLKRDYNDFQNQLNFIPTVKKTPKRISSSHKAPLEEKPILQKRQDSNSIKQAITPVLNKSQNNSNRWLKEKKALLNDHLKRQSWLRDEQTNIIKHSQLQHIFTNKLPKSNIYQLDQIKERTLPKIQRSHSGIEDSFVRKDKQMKGQNKINDQSDNLSKKLPSSKTKNTIIDAQARRQKAADTLQYRRKKLQQLLKTLW